MVKVKNIASRDSDDIQETGNILLKNTLEAIRKRFPDIKIIDRLEEDKNDHGIDQQIEILRKPKRNSIEMFKLQVKATDKPVKPLKTTDNEGLISFQIENKHIRYWHNEMKWAMLFILCDNFNEVIYWHAIQLDETLEDRLTQSLSKRKNTLQIFIDPKNILGPDTFRDFVNDARESQVTQSFRANEENETELTPSTDFKVDRNKPLLDQLYELMEYLYDEIQYLPTHLLSRYYPFRLNEGEPSFYHQFKLYTDNMELVIMLDSFKVQYDGSIEFTDPNFIDQVKDYEKKVKEILLKFSQNHIYKVICQEGRKEAATSYFTESSCSCSACCFQRLDIPQTIKSLQNPHGKSLHEQMKTAYMHYELGNYLRAAESFQQIGKEASKGRKKTLVLITQFNLIKLGKLIKSNYYDPNVIAYGEELMDINIDRAVYSARNRSHHRKLFNYIKEARFYIDNSFDIQTAMGKLRNEYHSFINGGSFITHSYDEMLNGFAQLNSFIGGNRIVYDKFGEYALQAEAFTEGIFIALALRETNSHALLAFSDYHIQRLIFDGNHKLTWRYFNKYHLKSIPYKPDGEGKFFNMICNLLTKHHLVKDAYKAYQPEEGSFWRNPYPKIFTNCLSLAALIEMNDQQAEHIARAIMDCYSKSDLPSPEAYGQVNSFFSVKRRQLSTEFLNELIAFFLPYKDMYLEKRMGIFTAELKTRKQLISLTKPQIKHLTDYAMYGEKDELRYFNTLSFFHPAGDKILRMEIENQIVKHLRTNFDTYTYYYAVLTNVLRFEGSEFLEKFLAATYPDPARYSFRNQFYGPQDNEYPLFDQFFNLCFKFELDPKTLTDKPLTGFGEYYDWLLDINGYDYTEFKISWISLHSTKFYLKEFSKHPILRKYVEEYLRSNRDPKIERLYFEIYTPKEVEEEEVPDYE